MRAPPASSSVASKEQLVQHTADETVLRVAAGSVTKKGRSRFKPRVILNRSEPPGEHRQPYIGLCQKVM